MPRIARVVVPNYPHHITQRGNRRQAVFFGDDDYQTYMDLMSTAVKRAAVEIWAYCLMPNHVHLIVTPKTEDGLRRLFAEAHRRYTRKINIRESWRGHLWQERFHSFVLDEQHLIAAVRYVELNPVRAGLCLHPQDWAWSSVHAHIDGRDDALVSVKPMLDRIHNWRQYLNAEMEENCLNDIRTHSRSGRPLGSEQFIEEMESVTGKALRKQKAGRKSSAK